jgi:hypothetical protein
MSLAARRGAVVLVGDVGTARRTGRLPGGVIDADAQSTSRHWVLLRLRPARGSPNRHARNGKIVLCGLPGAGTGPSTQAFPSQIGFNMVRCADPYARDVMAALILRKRGPLSRLRRRGMPARISRGPIQGPPDRLDFDDEAIELIGPGNDRAGEGM